VSRKPLLWKCRRNHLKKKAYVCLINFNSITIALRGQYCILTIPRARRVHQTLLTTPLSAFLSLIACIYHLSLLPLAKNQKWADILILNGPGTCFVLCITVYLNKFFGLQTPLVIYVESFARVKSLSLSGKLIRPLADRFILQWEESRDTQRRNRNTWLV